MSKSFDGRALRDAFGKFATGVTIVTTHAGGEDVGLTANSFSSLSLEPPMILWSLAKTSSNIEVFRRAESFAVHILAADQDSISAQFATKGINRFEGVDISRGYCNLPLLDACAACFECRTAFQYEGGDHVIFVGEVVDFKHIDKEPLIFHGGRYGTVVRREESRRADLEFEPTSLSTDECMFHLTRVFFQIRHNAQEERRRREWSDSEYAALSLLAREDGKTVAQLDALSRYPGRRVDNETIARLLKRGLVQAGGDRVFLTPAGRQAVIEIIAMIRAGEADALDGFSYGEVSLLKQLLKRASAKSRPGWPPLPEEQDPPR